MVAEREVDKPCTEASMLTLSASPSTQSTPAFGRKSEGRLSLTGMKSIGLSSPDLCLTPLREPIPLGLFEESPLGAISRLRYSNSPTRAKRRRLKTCSNPNDGQTTKENAVKSLTEVLPETSVVQTATGMLQENSTMTTHSERSHRPHSLLTSEEIKQGMRNLREQVAILNKQQMKELCHRLHQNETERKQISHTSCEVTNKVDETNKPAYTLTTTITGCGHRTSLSASHLERLSEHHLSPVVARLGELNYNTLAVGSSRNSSDKSHTDPSTSSAQSPTSVVGGELLVELLADTTSLKQESRMTQLEGGHLQGRRIPEAAMPAPEDSLLRKSTFTQDHTSLTTDQWKLSIFKRITQRWDLNRSLNPAEGQTEIVAEENHRPFPEEEDDDDIASLLEDLKRHQDSCFDAKLLLKKESSEWREQQCQKQDESTGLQQFLQCVKALAQLYWSTVWPMLDPRTLQIEHEGPMPFWKACLLIVLAAPAVTLGFVIIVQGMKLVKLMAWLLDYADDGSAIWI
ncbi:hypothetical protein ACHAQJ_008814 [Trichoderma viride]